MLEEHPEREDHHEADVAQQRRQVPKSTPVSTAVSTRSTPHSTAVSTQSTPLERSRRSIAAPAGTYSKGTAVRTQSTSVSTQSTPHTSIPYDHRRESPAEYPLRRMRTAPDYPNYRLGMYL